MRDGLGKLAIDPAQEGDHSPDGGMPEKAQSTRQSSPAGQSRWSILAAKWITRRPGNADGSGLHPMSFNRMNRLALDQRQPDFEVLHGAFAIHMLRQQPYHATPDRLAIHPHRAQARAGHAGNRKVVKTHQ